MKFRMLLHKDFDHIAMCLGIKCQSRFSQVKKGIKIMEKKDTSFIDCPCIAVTTEEGNKNFRPIFVFLSIIAEAGFVFKS